MKNIFSEKDLLSIFCGLPILLTPVVWGLLGVLTYSFNWSVGLLVVTVGTAGDVLCNYKKYFLARGMVSLSFGRCVVLDSLLLFLGMALVWAVCFIPDPFSWEAFMQPQESFIIPPGALAFAIFLAIPTLLTNKKITKDMNLK